MKDSGCSYTANWNWVIISTVVVAICTVLVIYNPAISDFDWSVLNTVKKFLEPYPSYIPLFFSEFGRENFMLWPQIAACSALLSNQKYLKTFLLVFFTQGAYVATGLLKEFVCRERPCGDAYPGFSFPSGHATTMTCFLGIIIYLILKYTRNTFWRYFLAAFFGLYIFMVGLSRLWLSHHFPIDVIAGMFLGVLLVNLYIILDKAFSK